MRRNGLTAALIRATAIDCSQFAQPLVPAPDNTLYPYYTATSEPPPPTRAVKVRFLEGNGSRDVLDFNLFVSPADVWTAKP